MHFLLIPVVLVCDQSLEDAGNNSEESESDVDMMNLWKYVAIGYEDESNAITFLSCRRDHLRVDVSWVRPISVGLRYSRSNLASRKTHTRSKVTTVTIYITIKS